MKLSELKCEIGDIVYGVCDKTDWFDTAIDAKVAVLKEVCVGNFKRDGVIYPILSENLDDGILDNINDNEPETHQYFYEKDEAMKLARDIVARKYIEEYDYT